MHQPKTGAIIHNEVTCAPNQRQKHLVLHGFSGPCSVEPTRRGGGTRGAAVNVMVCSCEVRARFGETFLSIEHKFSLLGSRNFGCSSPNSRRDAGKSQHSAAFAAPGSYYVCLPHQGSGLRAATPLLRRGLSQVHHWVIVFKRSARTRRWQAFACRELACQNDRDAKQGKETQHASARTDLQK